MQYKKCTAVLTGIVLASFLTAHASEGFTQKLDKAVKSPLANAVLVSGVAVMTVRAAWNLGKVVHSRYKQGSTHVDVAARHEIAPALTGASGAQAATGAAACAAPSPAFAQFSDRIDALEKRIETSTQSMCKIQASFQSAVSNAVQSNNDFTQALAAEWHALAARVSALEASHGTTQAASVVGRDGCAHRSTSSATEEPALQLQPRAAAAGQAAAAEVQKQ